MENHHRNGITMERYLSAVRNMEQTVMFPSLLQGVLLEDSDDTVEVNPGKKDSSDRDLYEYYTLLKSIRSMAESGLPPPNDQNLITREEKANEKSDLEGLFQYHISGLYHVLTQLTRRANTVTSKYNEILGQINQNVIPIRW